MKYYQYKGAWQEDVLIMDEDKGTWKWSFSPHINETSLSHLKEINTIMKEITEKEAFLILL